MRSIAPALAALLLCAACSPSARASPSDSPSAELPSEIPQTPAPTPYATMAGDLPALVIPLGGDSAPLDVVDAFGSIWVANHHSDDVSRLDPETGAEVARIYIGPRSGPAWFAVTDDAIWVTRQNGAGVTRIDPETNAVAEAQIGAQETCWAPAVALASVWYFACDSGLMVRIDIESNDSANVAADQLSPPLTVDDTLYAVASTGLVRLDPATSTFVPVVACQSCGRPIGFGAGTMWLSSQSGVTRVDLATGAVVGTLSLGGLINVTFVDDSAWGAIEGDPEILEIDPVTNEVVRELTVGPMPIKVLSAYGALWVTDFNSSELWRISLD